MIRVRPAEEADVPQIRALFVEVYGRDYPHAEVFDEHWLKRAIFSDDVIMLVAQDQESGTIAGTASVLCDFGAHSDLVGEFGRLAVHPDYRRMHVGMLLMEQRIRAVEDRLHLGLVLARVVHPYAQQISLANGFVPVGFLPLLHQFAHRESLALLAHFFGDALTLRKNNPRVIPEVVPLAQHVMETMSLPSDVIVDEDAGSYAGDAGLHLEELQVQACHSLLRIERGRVHHREIFGPMRLEYGFFRLRARHATYVLAKDGGRVVGAVGFTLDPAEGIARVFELIAFADQTIRVLLSELERTCREERGVQYIEIDVSAHAPRMQRTLMELKFMPVAYIPAMVFHEVERIDIVKMVRLMRLQDLGPLAMAPAVKAVADLVMRGFASRDVAPRIAEAVTESALFRGLDDEQVVRLAGACTLRCFAQGERIFSDSDRADRMYVVLDGAVSICVGDAESPIGTVRRGELLGEVAVLTSGVHSATAVADSMVEAGELTTQDLTALVRLRPDIGLILYRNLAVGLGTKLRRSDTLLRNRLGR